MASFQMHMAVAKLVNKELGMNENDLLVGSLAPDQTQFLNKQKNKSHFFSPKTGYIDYKIFFEKYKSIIKNDAYAMGYLIHLMTDYIWFSSCIQDLINSYMKKNNIESNLRYKDLKPEILKDYDKLTSVLAEEYDINTKNLKLTTNIKNSKVTEISKEELTNYLNYIKKYHKKINENYIIINKNDAKEFIEKTAKEIIILLNQKSN